MRDELSRKLPVALEAEQSVLGSILIDPDCFNKIAGVIRAEDFYLEEHQAIFNAMRKLFDASHEIDPVTLIDSLVRDGVYDKSGGANYIKLIADTVPTSANVLDYAHIVKDKSTLRRLIGACDEIEEIAYSEQGEIPAVLDSAEKKIFDIAQQRDTKNFEHIRDLVFRVHQHMEELSRNPEADAGIPTGFSPLDRTLVGLGEGDLVLIGARPGMGKTSFALNIGTNIAKQREKKNVCVFSLEMSGEQLVSRILSSEAMVDSYSMRRGNLTPDDWGKLAHAAGELSGCNILIDDTTGQTITAMKAKLRRVKNLGLVIIDYLQLMQGEKHGDNRVQEVADISRNLKIMAKELAVPVICCAQLSRGPESRESKKPMLSDLRDSGAIEQDADIVLFLYRGEYYKTDNDPTQQEQNFSTAEIIVAKNRHGSTGTVKMNWIGQFTKFVPIEEDRQE